MSIFTNAADAANDEASAYIEAVLQLVGSEDPLEILRATPSRLRELTASRSTEDLRKPEAPGKWSAAEVVQHFADSELVWGYRLRKVIAEERPSLAGYDQDLWADRLRYAEVEIEQALDVFAILRSANLWLVEGASENDLERVSVHAERGEESVMHMIRLYAGHDLVHLRQIERLLSSAS